MAEETSYSVQLPANPRYLGLLIRCIVRLYFLSRGTDEEELYGHASSVSAEDDEHILLSFLENTRDGWRSIRRRRRER